MAVTLARKAGAHTSSAVGRTTAATPGWPPRRRRAGATRTRVRPSRARLGATPRASGAARATRSALMRVPVAPFSTASTCACRGRHRSATAQPRDSSAARSPVGPNRRSGARSAVWASCADSRERRTADGPSTDARPDRRGSSIRRNAPSAPQRCRRAPNAQAKGARAQRSRPVESSVAWRTSVATLPAERGRRRARPGAQRQRNPPPARRSSTSSASGRRAQRSHDDDDRRPVVVTGLAQGRRAMPGSGNQRSASMKPSEPPPANRSARRAS